jgi:L-fuconolactonase
MQMQQGLRLAGAVVDSHCHFWDPVRLPYPWLAEVPSIARAHTPVELRAEAANEMPAQIVFVQAGCDRPMEEVRWIEELATSEPRIAAIVAFTPLDRGGETLAALQELRGRPLIRGARHLIQGETDPGFCLRPEFVAGVRALGEVGLTFDLCVRNHQLGSVTALVKRCPGTAFVLDHAGKPDIKNARVDPWRDDLARLGELPNVACKLSGLVAEADPATWSVDGLRPYVDHVLACFGSDRVAFGSDWPVVKIGSSFGGWLRAVQQLTSHLSDAARAGIFSENARRIYGLQPSLPSSQSAFSSSKGGS